MEKQTKQTFFYSSNEKRNLDNIVSSRLKVSNNNLRGFTLLEILIASSIFAIIMVITTGVVAQSSSYRSKLKAMREVSEETRRLSDMITRDIREADIGSVKSVQINVANPNGTPQYQTASFPTGIALFHHGQGVTHFKYTTASEITGQIPAFVLNPASSSVSAANVLLILKKDTYKIYFADSARVMYREEAYSSSELSAKQIYLTSKLWQMSGTGPNDYKVYGNASSGEIDMDTNYLFRYDIGGECSKSTPISNTRCDCKGIALTRLDFAGFAPTDINYTIQPYISFRISSVSRQNDDSTGANINFDTLEVTERFQSVIKSSVTLRSYPK